MSQENTHPRFLIIDDDPEYRELLAHHLTSHWPAARVDHIDPGDAGGEFEVKLGPEIDLVVLDHNLGRFNGLELLRQLKAGERCPPVIFLTGVGDEMLAVAAIRAGAEDYIPKRRLTHKLLIHAVKDALYQGTGAAADVGKASQPARDFMVTGYALRKRISVSRSASVYLAEHLGRRQTVVLKVLEQTADADADDGLLQRFLTEYETVSGLNHANIVRILDHGVADDHAYIAMEHIEGGDLRSRLLEGPIAAPVALDFAAQMAAALEVMHGAGILHRDLKPGNVMLRDDGTLALIDFGLAKTLRLDGEITEPGEVFGTPYYMSPEQASADHVDERGDLYSLGVILHEMLTGQKPFTGATAMAIIYKHRHAPRPRLPDHLDTYQSVLDKLLARRPEDRYSGADKLVTVLNSGKYR